MSTTTHERGTRLRYTAFALLLALGCSQGHHVRNSPGLTTEHVPPRDRPNLDPLSGELASIAEKMIVETQDARGLELESHLEIFEGTPEVVSWMLEREIDELRSSGDLAAEQAMLEAFGFIPPGMNLEALMLNLYEEQVTGLYDHREKILIVVPPKPSFREDSETSAFEPSKEQEKAWSDLQLSMFLVHEIVHALQDQHFGLERFLDDTSTFDERHATRALIEGDATFTMYDYLFRGLGKSLADLPSLDPIIHLLQSATEEPGHVSLMNAPLFIRETLLFPYLQGLLFTRALHELRGWEAVNAAFDTPPTTTQHIFHFERFLEGVGPERISIPTSMPLRNDGYELIAEGRLGELGLRIFIAEITSGTPGPGAACGWSGDAYAVYSRKGARPVALWALSFVDAEAATVFLDAVQDSASGSIHVHVHRFEPNFVGIITNLDKDSAPLVFESMEGAKREPSIMTPFTPASTAR